MKNVFIKSALPIALALVSSSAFAGGVECKTCPCAPSVNYIPKAQCNIKAAGTYCIKDNGHIYGWSISNDATYNVDSFAGMPNPYTSYHILPSTLDSSFKILEMMRSGEVVSEHGPFQWIGTEAITDGTKTFEKSACK
ncbi:MAG: hypothetical protein EOP06_19970 [Proteobacteria bacterium]|nr:MAG: hypothetical protein EOP06_19970 [Pseudomonadota bacterium]